MHRGEVVTAVEGFNARWRVSTPTALGRQGLARAHGLDWDACNTQLVVYGSLAPGELNHHQLASLKGTWQTGSVRGRLHRAGWGSEHGFPGFRWDETAEHLAVQLFTSTDLPNHWKRLDAFEGEDYVRLLVPVDVQNHLSVANIYAIAK